MSTVINMGGTFSRLLKGHIKRCVGTSFSAPNNIPIRGLFDATGSTVGTIKSDFSGMSSGVESFRRDGGDMRDIILRVRGVRSTVRVNMLSAGSNIRGLDRRFSDLCRTTRADFRTCRALMCTAFSSNDITSGTCRSTKAGIGGLGRSIAKCSSRALGGVRSLVAGLGRLSDASPAGPRVTRLRSRLFGLVNISSSTAGTVSGFRDCMGARGLG